MAKAPSSQTLILTEDGSTIAMTAALAVTIPAIVIELPPAFIGQPSIASDGTPQVGEQLTGVDAAVSNLGVAVLRRAWLLGTTILTEEAAFTPDDDVTYTFRNELVVAGVVVATVRVDVTVGAPVTTEQLLAPTVFPSAHEDTTSAAFQVTLREDLRLSDNGYLGFGLRIERATDAAFTQGYVSQMVLINTPMMIEEGLADFAILRGLGENTTYHFRFSVVPPAQSSFSVSPGAVRSVAIGAVPTSTFVADLPAGYTSSNGGRTATGGDGAGDRVAKTATSHTGANGRFVLEARHEAEGEPRFALGVITAEASTSSPFGGSTSTIVYFNGDEPGYVLSNGSGGAYAFDTDSGIVLPAGVYQLLVDCAENTVTGYRGNKRGAPISMSGDLAGAVKHGFVQLGFKAATDTDPAAADVGTWTNSGVRVANSEAWL